MILSILKEYLIQQGHIKLKNIYAEVSRVLKNCTQVKVKVFYLYLDL